MPAKSISLIARLFLGLCLLSLGCNSLSPGMKKESPIDNSKPVKSMKTTIDVNQSEEYLAQLQKFADKHSLEFTVNFYNSQKTDFFVVIYGNGFHINSTASPDLTKDIGIYFLNDGVTPTPQETVDELFTDLKNFIKEIPNVMISEQVKLLKITMDKGKEQELFTEFFTHLQDFADRHSLQFIEYSYDSDMSIFLVEMDGDGFKIMSEGIVSAPGKFFVNFHIHFDDNGDPTPTSQEIVDELFNDIKGIFGEIPGVTINEEN